MENFLEVRELYKEYNPRKKNKRVVAVDHVSFSGQRGEVLGLLGPNGSGKSSTIKSIATIIDFEGGSISVNGLDVLRQRKKVLEIVGAVLEGARNVYWTLSPVENMKYFGALKGLSVGQIKDRIERYLELFDLKEVAHKQVREFSKGMQQKVAIACALISDPPLLLLDEPTLGLDVETARTMRTVIHRLADEGKLVLVTSHDMRFIERVCDRVVVVKKGKVVASNKVSALHEFFQRKAYTISLSSPIDDERLAALNAVTPIHGLQAEVGQRLRFVLEEPKDLYEIFDILRGSGADLAGLDVDKDDLEEIFLSLVNESNESELQPEGVLV